MHTALETKGDLREGIGHLLLDELGVGQGAPKLLPLQGVVAGCLQTELSCSQGAPCDTKAGIVETAEGALVGRYEGSIIILLSKHM